MAIITNEGISYKPSLLDRITSKHIIEIYQKQEEFYRKQGELFSKITKRGKRINGKMTTDLSLYFNYYKKNIWICQ